MIETDVNKGNQYSKKLERIHVPAPFMRILLFIVIVNAKRLLTEPLHVELVEQEE